ncbi:GspE/PulE family protein [Desulfonauticus submarinus]
MKQNIKLGSLLISKKIIQQKHLDYALRVQRVTGEKLGQILTRMGLVNEYDLIQTVSEQLKIPYINLFQEKPDPKIIKKFNRNTCMQYLFFPLREENNQIIIATSNTPNIKIAQACYKATGQKPKYYLTEESILIDYIYTHFYFLEHPVEQILQQEAEKLAKDATMSLSPDACVQYLLLLAVKKKATDIHISPMEKGISVSFRIDGILRNEYFFPPELKRLIHAMKLQAGMDISEQRLPQDGRWSVKILNKRYELRASTIITPYGENIVLRLLPQEKSVLGLPNLGFFEEDIKKLRQVFSEPFGIILLTGPTGSGKSTTLVAGLMSLDLVSKNVLTIEDPIEYLVPLARQSQVNEAAGYNFANAMRYFLRHDPDIILVGEIRDDVTAKITMTAANTGHLVLSTLHTNTALGAISRLKNLGIDNLTIGESLICIINQRLVRVLCKYCKEKYIPSDKEITYLNKKVPFLFKAKGCEACNFTGYNGRTVIYEIVTIDKQIESLIEKDASLVDIKKILERKGFKSIMDIGKEKVIRGITSIRELQRVIGYRVQD